MDTLVFHVIEKKEKTSIPVYKKLLSTSIYVYRLVFFIGVFQKSHSSHFYRLVFLFGCSKYIDLFLAI